MKLNVCAVDLQALLKVSSEQSVSAVPSVLRECLLNVQTVVKEGILLRGLFQ